MTYECNLFEICKEYYSADDIKFRLPIIIVCFVLFHSTVAGRTACPNDGVFSINQSIGQYSYFFAIKLHNYVTTMISVCS